MKLKKGTSYKIDLSWLCGKTREAISEQIQERLFAIGKTGKDCFDNDYNECENTNGPYLYICNRLLWGNSKSSFEQKPFIELSVEQAVSIDGWEEEKGDYVNGYRRTGKYSYEANCNDCISTDVEKEEKSCSDCIFIGNPVFDKPCCDCYGEQNGNLEHTNFISKTDPYAELKKAYAEGKKIQYLDNETREWTDVVGKPNFIPRNSSWYIFIPKKPEEYRIKPEPKYRPWTKETCPWEKLLGMKLVVIGSDDVIHRMITGYFKAGLVVVGDYEITLQD
ncbi:MAG: hypothetical protein Q4F84_08175, partial [Fibrobacter sp.]|nr:hypothetical protein [Fibrobacter sp.]